MIVVALTLLSVTGRVAYGGRPTLLRCRPLNAVEIFRMDSSKALAIAVMAMISATALAAENNNPFQAALMITTIVPCVIVSGATAATSSIPDLFKSAKSDALAFIGSDGDIRGSEFEQASRYYRATYSRPLMSDQQLALAIAASL